MIDPVCIRTFAFPHEAEIAALTLDTHGIDVRIGSQQVSDTVMGSLGSTGTRMFVEAVDVDRAIEVLTGSATRDGNEPELSTEELSRQWERDESENDEDLSDAYPDVETPEVTAVDEDLQALYGYAATQLQQGLSLELLASDLVSEGLDEESATTVIREMAEAIREAGRRKVMYGGLWFLGGIAVTVGTYMVAPNGGTYLVAWGAILFGAIQAVQGWSQADSLRPDSEEHDPL